MLALVGRLRSLGQLGFLPKQARDRGCHQALRDTTVVSAFHPERLDPGEVLKVPAPQDNISDHLIELETRSSHCGKCCIGESANNLYY